MGKIRVGVLGATGTVGQRIISLLEKHPLFEVTALPSVLLLAKGGEILYYGFRLPDKEKIEFALGV